MLKASAVKVVEVNMQGYGSLEIYAQLSFSSAWKGLKEQSVVSTGAASFDAQLPQRLRTRMRAAEAWALLWSPWRFDNLIKQTMTAVQSACRELQVAEAALMDVRVDGSLLVHADCVMGSLETPWEAAAAAIRRPSDIHVSHPDGRQILYPADAHAGAPQQPSSGAAAHSSGAPLFSDGALHLQASAAAHACLCFRLRLSHCRVHCTFACHLQEPLPWFGACMRNWATHTTDKVVNQH